MAGAFFAYGTNLPIASLFLFAILGEWLALCLGYFLGYIKFAHLINLFKQEKHAKQLEKLLKKNEVSIMTTSLIWGLTRFWVAYIAGGSGLIDLPTLATTITLGMGLGLYLNTPFSKFR